MDEIYKALNIMLQIDYIIKHWITCGLHKHSIMMLHVDYITKHSI